MSRVVVIGVGNRYRRDDGAGPAVLDALAHTGAARRARLVELDGEPARVVEAWTGADVAFVVDAVRTAGAAAGTVHRIEEPDSGELADGAGRAAGSHALGIGSAAALGRALGRLPERLVVFGITGDDFGHGEQVSAPVAVAVAAVAAQVAAEVEAAG